MLKTYQFKTDSYSEATYL